MTDMGTVSFRVRLTLLSSFPAAGSVRATDGPWHCPAPPAACSNAEVHGIVTVWRRTTRKRRGRRKRRKTKKGVMRCGKERRR